MDNSLASEEILSSENEDDICLEYHRNQKNVFNSVEGRR